MGPTACPFDGGFGVFNRFDFEEVTFGGCLLNVIKLIVIFAILFFVFAKLGG